MDYHTAFPEEDCVLFIDGLNASLEERTRSPPTGRFHRSQAPRPHESDFGVPKLIELIRSLGGSPGYRGV
jgi:hypothetical protein